MHLTLPVALPVHRPWLGRRARTTESVPAALHGVWCVYACVDCLGSIPPSPAARLVVMVEKLKCGYDCPKCGLAGESDIAPLPWRELSPEALSLLLEELDKLNQPPGPPAD